MSHYQERVIERLRERLADERMRRQDDLRDMQVRHDRIVAIGEAARLDAIQLAETRRIDANRAADAAAVVLSTTRGELTATTLAEKVADSASTLATQVEQTKIAAGLAVDATTQTLGTRIKPLEDARYENSGRQGGRADVVKALYLGFGMIIPVVIYLLGKALG